ncbi:MAG: ABC transporter permease [Acidimicrobiales bacterium]|jgi:peptide/nickel transport system permease protein
MHRPADVDVEVGFSRPAGSGVMKRFMRNRSALLAVVVIVLIAGFSFLGPLVYRTGPNAVDPSSILAGPSSLHPLGTDGVGRDVLARLMFGGRISLIVGVLAAVLGVVTGMVYGAIAGVFGGIVDALLMRLADIVLSLPVLVLLIVLSAEFRPSELMMVVVIGLTTWPVPARLVRGETLSLMQREFVQAAHQMGARRGWTIFRHILPNTVGTIVVNATFQVADAILLIAYLSYLGLGIPPPAPTWGGILTDGLTYLYEGTWWLIWAPGLAILVTVVAFNYLGDALRDAFDLRFERAGRIV